MTAFLRKSRGIGSLAGFLGEEAGLQGSRPAPPPRDRVKTALVIIGATGSVGGAVLDICRRFPDRFRVCVLAARSNAEKLFELTREFHPYYASLEAPSAEETSRFKEIGVRLFTGREELVKLVTLPEITHIVFAASGTDTIPALQAALRAGKNVSLANKESVVAAGPWVMPLVQRPDQLRPIDSEHSAIWQCIRSEPGNPVERIWLTASGGPFLRTPKEDLARVTPEEALRHPTWTMGRKITIDSATLMNKGIECIEAMQLFGLPASRVGALIHPKSQVHGLVEFGDATVKLLLSDADMRLPAGAALAWPEPLPLTDRGFKTPPPSSWSLEFSEPDAERFPCFPLAIEAGRRGGAYPPLLIGADEAAVDAFLERRIPFPSIAAIIERTLEAYAGSQPQTVQDAIELIAEGRRMAEAACRAMGG